MKFFVESVWTPGSSTVTPGPWAVTVEGDRVSQLALGRPGETDLYLRGTALPGYVDMHEHIGIDVGDEHLQSIEPAGRMLLRGAANLRTMVEGGVTTIRDCGERSDVEGFWVEAVAEGILPGPRIVRSVSPICRTGGHAWYLGAQTDGVENLHARVRELRRDGADFIKFMTSGGIGTAGSDRSAAEYRTEEVEAIVGEAKRLGLHVAAHGHGGRGVADAIVAGVDTIEHGALLTESDLALMVEHGTTLVLTNAVIRAYCSDPRVPEAIRETMAPFAAVAMETTRRALASGVRIALGSDCVHGGIDQEIEILLECGFTPVQALEAATIAGARVLGDQSLGVLTEGSYADIQVVAGDPIEDPHTLTRRLGVMTRGTWFTDPLPSPLSTDR